MKPHQNTAPYAERLVIRFASKDEQQASIEFSAGKPGAGSDTKQGVSAALKSSSYYVADMERTKAGHPYNICHAVPPLQPGLAWLTLLADLYPALDGSEQLQLPSSVQFMDDLIEWLRMTSTYHSASFSHELYMEGSYSCSEPSNYEGHARLTILLQAIRLQ